MTNWFDDPPPPLQRHKFEFAPRMPDDPPIQTDIIREAIRDMDEVEIRNMAKAILSVADAKPTRFEVDLLFMRLTMWAINPS